MRVLELCTLILGPATTGFPGRLPLKTGVFIGDYLGALMGCLSVLSALHYRQRTGQGQFIEYSQGEGLMQVLDWSWMYYYLEKFNRPRTGNRDRAICPSGVFMCKDGPVALAAGKDMEFKGLCEAMGKPEADNEYIFLRYLEIGREKLREWEKENLVWEFAGPVAPTPAKAGVGAGIGIFSRVVRHNAQRHTGTRPSSIVSSIPSPRRMPSGPRHCAGPVSS